jgi:serine/threonine protein kinase/Tfp pilus assembly protein PilF
MPPQDRNLEGQRESLLRRQWASSETLQASSLDIRNGEDLCAVLQRHGLLSPEQAAQVRVDARQLISQADPRRRLAQELARELQKSPLFAPHAAALFEPRAVIGSGGMGQVIKVFDRRLQREAALKKLKPDADRDDLHRFLREARITAALAHPNIPAIHEAGISPEGEHYILMQLVSGETLASRLESLGGSKPTAAQRHELVEVIARAAEAVAYAHSMGYVHRDLSPANIMIGEFGEVLVMDWGLARELKDEKDDPNLASAGFHTQVKSDSGAETAAGIILGTPGYMSPEQARGAAVDVESDIYALGLLLTQVLTNQPAIAGSEAYELISRSVRGQAATPRMLDPAIPADIDALVSRALDPDPRRRLVSTSSLIENLRAWLVGSDLPIYNYSALQRLERSLKRRSTFLLSCIALSLFVTLILAIFMASKHKVDQLRNSLSQLESEANQLREDYATAGTNLAWQVLESKVITAPKRVTRDEIMALEPNPTSAKQLSRAARLLAGIGDFPSAEALLSDSTPDLVCARIWLGAASDPRRLLEDGPAAKELERMASSPRIRPLWELFLACRGSHWPKAATLLPPTRAHKDLGDWEKKLIDLLESLIASSMPNNRQLTERCLRFIDNDPLDLCHKMMAAEILLEQRRSIEALRFLGDLLDRLPGAVRPRTHLATLLLEWNQIPEAMTELDTLLAAHPHEITVRLTKAMALLRIARPNDAAAQVRQALERDSSRFDAHHLLAQSLLACNDYDAAFKAYEQAIRLAIAAPAERTAANYIYERAMIRQRLGASFDSIIEDLGEALRYDATMDRARFTRAKLLARSGRAELAQSELSTLRNTPDLNPELRLESAALLAELGLAEPALSDALSMTRADPNNERAWTILGNIQFNLKQFNDARESYSQAKLLRPQNGDNYYNLAVTLEALKRFEEALSTLDQGLRWNGPPGRIHLARARCLARLARTSEALAALEIAALDPDPKISNEARRFYTVLSKN